MFYFVDYYTDANECTTYLASNLIFNTNVKIKDDNLLNEILDIKRVEKSVFIFDINRFKFNNNSLFIYKSHCLVFYKQVLYYMGINNHSKKLEIIKRYLGHELHYLLSEHISYNIIKEFVIKESSKIEVIFDIPSKYKLTNILETDNRIILNINDKNYEIDIVDDMTTIVVNGCLYHYIDKNRIVYDTNEVKVVDENTRKVINFTEIGYLPIDRVNIKSANS